MLLKHLQKLVLHNPAARDMHKSSQPLVLICNQHHLALLFGICRKFAAAGDDLQSSPFSKGFIIPPTNKIFLNSITLCIMGINNKISAGYAYYLTLTIEEWIDVLSRPVYKHIIVDSLNYCIANKGLVVYCWCLMSNHLHLVACASEDGNLSDILRDFKKFTSKAIIDTIKEVPESRRDWMLNLFWYAGKNNKKIKYFKVWQDPAPSDL